jgi:hypothetical protein
MKIFVIVGMPAAGKNIGRIYAESKRYPMEDAIREMDGIVTENSPAGRLS